MPDATAPSPPVSGPPAAPVWPVRLIRILATAALVVSAYLLIVSLREHGHPVGCGAGSGCDEVLSSPWSSWLGIPVSFFAAAVDLLVLTTSLQLGPRVPEQLRQRAWGVMLMLATMAAGGAAWFIFVQLRILGHVCIYCMTDHAIGLMMAAAIAGAIFSHVPRMKKSVPVTAALVSLAILIGGQLAYQPKMLRVDLMGGRIALNAAVYPVIGNPAVPHVLVSLVDYTCPHCRAMHGDLMEALKRYGDQAALLVLPMPLDRSCNPYVTETEPRHKDACGLARLAIAVWLAAPGEFSRYDAWLFEPEMPRPLEEARAEAESLVGKAGLDHALADPRVDEIIRKDIELHHDTAGPDDIYDRLPKVFAGGTILTGEPGSANELLEALDQATGLHADGPTATAPFR